ncbi:hypothetical protein [Lacticaseibacillus camelliae]|nr:hypothetical protein [Lacticaseibacillus camelliae]
MTAVKVCGLMTEADVDLVNRVRRITRGLSWRQGAIRSARSGQWRWRRV